jgi:hypothetical protein
LIEEQYDIERVLDAWERIYGAIWKRKHAR